MRDEQELEAAKEALQNRLESDDHHPMMNLFNQPKRDVVVGVLHGDDDPQEVIDGVREKLRSGSMELSTFIQLQAASNAAAWCQGDLDSI